MILRVTSNGAWLSTGGSGYEYVADWLQLLEHTLKTQASDIPPDAPPFCGGWIGWFSYESGPLFDKVSAHPPYMGIDLAVFAYYPVVDAFDYAERRRWRSLVENVSGTEAAALDDAIALPEPAKAADITCNFTRHEYLAAVNKAVDYIKAGDVYQINLSQQFSVSGDLSMPSVYIRARENSPSPYSAFISLGDTSLVSISPELFLDADMMSGEIISRPIKGTRRRGTDHNEDVALAKELSASEKDRAENVMIVDLVRNDLGRVCISGSVETPEVCRLEIHPSVFHLVSTVKGRLDPDVSLCDIITAAFPGGSITGTPKIRATEIIKDLEPTPRGPYTGAYGYFSHSGRAKLAMSIRVIWNNGSRLMISAGGGIVADSDPEDEYQETLTKASAMLRAVGCMEGAIV